MPIRGGAGRLRNRVTIQKLTETTGSDGGITVAYTDLAEVYAEIKPLKPEERISARRVEGVTTHQIRMRYFDDISTADRIVHDGRAFNIEGHWNTFERDQETVVLAVEVSV